MARLAALALSNMFCDQRLCPPGAVRNRLLSCTSFWGERTLATRVYFTGEAPISVATLPTALNTRARKRDARLSALLSMVRRTSDAPTSDDDGDPSA